MGKKTVFTRITPLPRNVPRQLALDMLHSHEEIIRLNPLVTGVKSIDAPRDSPSEEYFSNWYEIYETITVGLGYKKKISFKTVFHDHPWGCQTHAYAPFGVDLRNKYRIGGNQPGEPREVKELGVETPVEGLYIREDVEIVCNVPLTTGFVKKETKESIGVMVDRIGRKAELLDEGKLHAMFENGKLKTAKPNLDATFDDRPLPSPGFQHSPPGSPALSHYSMDGPKSPPPDGKGFGRYRDIMARENSIREGSIRSSYVPPFHHPSYVAPHQYTNGGAEQNGNRTAPTAFMSELPASTSFAPADPRAQQYPENSLYPQPLQPLKSGGLGGAVFRSELPGDTTLPPPAANQDTKPQPPPESQHPAYANTLQPPSPPERSSARNSSQGSAYKISNPDQPSPPYPTNSPSQTNGSTNNLKPRASASNIQQWQHSVQSDPPLDDAYYRNARSSQGSTQQHPARSSGGSKPARSSGGSQPENSMQNFSRQLRRGSGSGSPTQQMQPDHQRFAGLGIREEVDARIDGRGRRSNGNSSGEAKGAGVQCPVCGMFEGDEAAVSHHVSKAHFS